MGFIPKDAEWYIAEIIITYEFSDSPTTDVELVSVLIHATSPEEAYTKALQEGQLRVSTYENTDGDTVQKQFLGLSNLTVVLDKLEDGAELVFSWLKNTTEEQRNELLTPKEELGVFAPITPLYP